MNHSLAKSLIVIFLLFFLNGAGAMQPEKHHFKVIPLGVSGGEFQDNLSAYLIAPMQSDQWIALDAGTVCSEINKIPIKELKQFNIKSHEELFTKQIKAYLITHAHLDHINGLIICSTMDSNKEILGLDTTINFIRDNIFNWKIWPNFGDEGEQPWLKKYHYHRLSVDKNSLIPKTTLFVRAFPLNHGKGYPSTAFLLKADNHYLLYLGDTGADNIEKSQDLKQIWQEIAPLIRSHQLNTVFIECSYSNKQSDALLFGHLKPKWLNYELHELAKIVNPEFPNKALNGLNVVITHIKQGFGDNAIPQLILQELDKNNVLKVRFILPQQGKPMSF